MDKNKLIIFLSTSFSFLAATMYSCQDLNKNTIALDDLATQLIRNAETFNRLFQPDTIKLRLPTEISIGKITAINVLPNGKIIVADDRYAKIVILFDKRGNFISQIGQRGQGPGEYMKPAYLGSNSKNEIIIADRKLYRISFFSQSGKYKRSFTVKHPIRQLLISSEDEIIIHYNNGNFVENTIRIYNDEGNLRKKFGRRSKTTNLMWRIFPFETPGPFLAIDGDLLFETDYADYHLRKYTTVGKELFEFGVQPVEWRSLTPEAYKPIPKGIVTAAVKKQMDDFFENKIDRSSLIWLVYSLKPGLIALLVSNRPKIGYPRQYFFDIYSTQGELIKSGLELEGFPASKDSPRTSLHVSLPNKLFFSQYIDSDEEINQEVQLIRFTLKEF